MTLTAYYKKKVGDDREMAYFNSPQFPLKFLDKLWEDHGRRIIDQMHSHRSVYLRDNELVFTPNLFNQGSSSIIHLTSDLIELYKTERRNEKIDDLLNE